jgi:uncharacterized membrane protein YhaH (DUF805 family)
MTSSQVNRTARLISHIAAVFSVAAFAAALIVAVRAQRTSDAIWWHSLWHTPPATMWDIGAGTSREGLIVRRQYERYEAFSASVQASELYDALVAREGERAGWHHFRHVAFDSPGTVLGFGIQQSNSVRPSISPSRMERDEWVVRIPHWFLLLATAVPNVVMFVRWRSQRLVAHRVAAGLCVACGYDLRAALGGRCPECGTDTPPEPPPAPAGRVALTRAR